MVKAFVAVEPGWAVVNVPPSGNGQSVLPWGLAWIPLTYSPAVSDPSELQFEVVPRTGYPDIETCWLQKEPARQLPNLAQVPVMLPLSESGYDTGWNFCMSEFLTQAGVNNTFLPLVDLGIHGNGHFMFIEKNSDQIAGVVHDWLRSVVKD
jgi:hypothetical protein